MIVWRKIKIVLLTGLVGLLALEAVGRLSAPVPFGLVSPAEARVGRPLSAGQFCRGGKTHGTAVRRGRVLLLGVRSGI